jgi:mRNA-degrading endonuclease toxin of MazEF toxin-antitoxin module
MEKDFIRWHSLKEKLHKRQDYPHFNEREIWWCSVGANVGHEQDGKGLRFTRPVLIFRKFSRYTFWGLPLTTQLKKGSYYCRIMTDEGERDLMLSQVRLWSSQRLTMRMGRIGEEQFDKVRQAFRCLT